MSKIRNIKHYNVDLTSSFADIAYRLQDPEPQSIGYHCHEGYEIMQMWSDSGYLLVDDKIFPIQKGHIYIINALESHCSNPASGTPYIRSKITFSASYIHGLLGQMGQLSLLEPFISKGKSSCNWLNPDNHMQEEFDRLFEKIAGENSTGGESYQALINAYLVEMLVMIYRWYSINKNSALSQPQKINEHINRIIEYLNRKLFEDISIDDLCERMHLSKYYLCHLFKRATGLTIMQYILERRISEAKKLLTSSDEAVSKVAVSTGFNSFSVFSRTFKRITGYTPMGYKKRFSGIQPGI